MKNKKIKLSREDRLFMVLSYSITLFCAIVCVVPFLMLVVGSFSNNSRIVIEGYGLLPKGFTFEAYNVIFKQSDKILKAYQITILVTLIGTVSGVLITTMGGYVLSRKDFKYRYAVSMFVYFTSIFSGGMIPSFLIFTKVLHLYDNIWALILPMLTSFFNVFLYRNFANGIPDSLVEAGKLDGASDLGVFFKIVLPISKPAVATIALFTALAYWNDWYRSSIYIRNQDLIMLQYLLHKMMLNTSSALREASGSLDVSLVDLPTETVKLATAVVTTGPVLLFYPFAQKYFVGGITIGSVKG